MSEINNERAFDQSDQDPELVAQAIAEAMKKITQHFRKIAVGSEVITEVTRQEELRGEQNHPLSPGDGEGYRLQHDHLMKHWQSLNGYRLAQGQLAWDGILLEEVYEALAERDPEKREAELTQVAAVAVSMILASRRARGGVNL